MQERGVWATIGIPDFILIDLRVGTARWKRPPRGGRKKLFKLGNFYRAPLSSALSHDCVETRRFHLTRRPSSCASLAFNIGAYMRQFCALRWHDAYFTFLIGSARYPTCQTPDAARKCGRLWILIRWNFNLRIFPSFPSELRGGSRGT